MAKVSNFLSLPRHKIFIVNIAIVLILREILKNLQTTSQLQHLPLYIGAFLVEKSEDYNTDNDDDIRSSKRFGS
ncbi:hypothetical protein YC2023_065524 [Brassica napus]